MSTNKNALIRYKALDKCLSNKYKRYYINDLIQACNDVLYEHYGEEVTVSRRQIFNDIEFMKSDAGYEAPIISVKDGRKVYYQYEDMNFSILSKPLTRDELLTLDNTLEIISRMKGIPGIDNVASIEAKLLNAKQLPEQRQIISFEENEFLIGIEFLSPLYNYIKNKQTLIIDYKSYKSDKQQSIIFSPYYLKQYNNRWFVIGKDKLYPRIQNLALDRIIKLNPTTDSFEETTIDFDEYFDDIIGVTNFEKNKIEDVVIEVSDTILPYIISKPLHGSQKITGNLLKLKLKINYELESLILSYGEDMRVLKPESLVKCLKDRINILKNNY